MLSWFKLWFDDLKVNTAAVRMDNRTPFVIHARGVKVAESTSRKEAERYIQELFDETEYKRVSGKGHKQHGGTTVKGRQDGFRQSFVITEMCRTCSRKVGHCGQC